MVVTKLRFLVHLFLLLLMAFIPPTSSDDQHHHHQQLQKKKKKRKKQPQAPQPKETSSWEQLKSLFSCKSTAANHVHDPSITNEPTNYTKISSACGSSICAIRDVVHGNTRVVHRSDTDRNSGASSPGDSRRQETVPLSRRHLSSSGSGYARGGMPPLRRLSGCYECHAVSVDSASRRYPRPRQLCACKECGEVFTKPETLELHQAIQHAVSELAPEDSGRHIVEIIFKSSWHRRRDLPGACRIDRILKIHNTPRTIARFEDCRSAVKSRFAPNPKKHPRCAADGNELLRFLPVPISCPLGALGSTSLCSASGSCGVCAIIRHGFAKGARGVRTLASSGWAHEIGGSTGGGAQRAMMVCRVIAGRVRRVGEEPLAAAAEEAYDSVVGGDDAFGSGNFPNLEELFVINPKAILPCFVVIYRMLP